MVYGDYADKAPQAAVIDAVAHADIDVAVVWGPTAGTSLHVHPNRSS